MGGNKKSREKRREEKHQQRQHMLQQLQDVLGLTHPEFQSFDSLPQINRPKEECPVLVAIDFELWEVNGSTITEIGLAVLDPLLLRGLAPGDRGANWWSLVYAKHIWIKECQHMVNREYVSGCPESFNFGKTDIIPQRIKLELTKSFLEEILVPRRPLYVVGHDVGQDIQSFDNMGLMLESLTSELTLIDSREIYTLLANTHQGPSLGSALTGLNMDSRNLHNAGNDAVYTLRACLALALILKESDPQAYKTRELLDWK
ncbi:QDE-2-interacting protein [Ceratocystis lukuohia]|uniref:QDE-2-interacting protein n=1 Tax=Ceratocystis lukuohia TaxID=2019550 RepID=A0ABR4MLG6_9PEZI